MSLQHKTIESKDVTIQIQGGVNSSTQVKNVTYIDDILYMRTKVQFFL